MKNLLVLILIFSFVLSACAAPEAPPEPTPKPTWTMRPHGTFKGCIYYDGELIEGHFQIKDMDGNTVLWTDDISECLEYPLAPGKYNVEGQTWEGEDCSRENAGPAGCDTNRGEGIIITIEVDQTTEVEFHVEPY